MQNVNVFVADKPVIWVAKCRTASYLVWYQTVLQTCILRVMPF